MVSGFATHCLVKRFIQLKRYVARLSGLAILLLADHAHALNILVVNDDGLTGHVKALYSALVGRGHDVLVSTPCYGQSGMGAAIKIMQPISPLEEDCLNGAASAGDPGVGPVTQSGDAFDYSHFHYVDGTPVMATAYGLDVLAQRRWGAAPDLVISGPNQGPNVGAMVLNSGTVSNAQFALTRGIPALAVSVGLDMQNMDEASGSHTGGKQSAVAAEHTVTLVEMLRKKAGQGPLLPAGVALNVNLPADVNADTPFAFSRIGTYLPFRFRFVEDLSRDPNAGPRVSAALPGISVAMIEGKPAAAQREDEAFVSQRAIAVSAMQMGYEHAPDSQQWLRRHLKGLIGQ